MITALNIANNFLERAFAENIPISPMKMQKLIYILYKEYLNPTIYQKYFYLFFYLSNSLKLLDSKPFITFNCILFYVVISVTTNFIIQKLLFLSLGGGKTLLGGASFNDLLYP